jgi:hypothetical protein
MNRGLQRFAIEGGSKTCAISAQSNLLQAMFFRVFKGTMGAHVECVRISDPDKRFMGALRFCEGVEHVSIPSRRLLFPPRPPSEGHSCQ